MPRSYANTANVTSSQFAADSHFCAASPDGTDGRTIVVNEAAAANQRPDGGGRNRCLSGWCCRVRLLVFVRAASVDTLGVRDERRQLCLPASGVAATHATGNRPDARQTAVCQGQDKQDAARSASESHDASGWGSGRIGGKV